MANLGDGITINDSPANTIGGTAPRRATSSRATPERRLDRQQHGSRRERGTSSRATSIGTDAAGEAALGNGGDGILIQNTASTVVGGTAAGPATSSRATRPSGLHIAGTSTGTVVQGNLIGTDAAGEAALGNTFGVFLDDAVGNLIGGTTPAARNVISGNTSIGIQDFRVSPAAANVSRRQCDRGELHRHRRHRHRGLGNGSGTTAQASGFSSTTRGGPDRQQRDLGQQLRGHLDLGQVGRAEHRQPGRGQH